MILKSTGGTSLAVQWLRFCLPMRGSASSIPGWGAETPHASCPRKTKQNIKQKQYCNKFKKGFKKGLHQKNYFKKSSGIGEIRTWFKYYNGHSHYLKVLGQVTFPLQASVTSFIKQKKGYSLWGCGYEV